MKHILLVEDEPKIAQLLLDYLHSSHYETTHIDHGNDVLPWVKENHPDLILLDLMLPGTDGLDICTQIRTFSHVPVIMLTARIEEIDQILGLEIGADDYICKPFRPREVMARIKALLRRTEFDKSPYPISTPLHINENRHIASYNDHILDLTPIEFRLLQTLSGAPGHVFARQTLLDGLYPDNRVVTNRTVDTHIKNLRKKLTVSGADHDVICSIYGIGYKWMD